MRLHKLVTLPVHRMILALAGCMQSLAALAGFADAAVRRDGESLTYAVVSACLAVLAWSAYYGLGLGGRDGRTVRLVALLLVTLLAVASAAYVPPWPWPSWVPLVFLPVAASLLTNAKAYAVYVLFFLPSFAAAACMGWPAAAIETGDSVLTAVSRISLVAGSTVLGAIVLAAHGQRERHAEARALRQQRQQLVNMLQCFIPVGERKTQTSRAEIERMSALMKALYAECGGAGRQDWEIELLSLMHFVSRVKLPDYMFEKEGKLTGFELEVVKEHCFMAKELCEGVPGFAEIQNAFLYHHERVDGTGYPYRLKADRIPMLSQMLGLAEVYLAMTTERSYRRAMSRTEAYEEIRKLSGTAFRPDLVEALGRTL
ncbi:HD-GYP domain-containing protein [Cohnella hashimotonis]|uniref:HD domain-containing phosphohydrolase n=1 Tax=Cohnella hashimotonis TaxID=2826895 RepID=A0ABT6TVN2_9BACL|nr:HD domain-containing phosphohydrolase [Cohnella hashimotonis]